MRRSALKVGDEARREGAPPFSSGLPHRGPLRSLGPYPGAELRRLRDGVLGVGVLKDMTEIMRGRMKTFPIPTSSSFLAGFSGNFASCLHFSSNSSVICKIFAKFISKKLRVQIPPNFHQNQAEKALVFFRRMKFHFLSPKFDADFFFCEFLRGEDEAIFNENKKMKT